MIYTNVDEDRVLREEPSLKHYQFSDQLGFKEFIEDAYNEVMLDIRNTDLDNKKLQMPLVLQESTELTSTNTGDQSAYDYIERNMLITKVESGEAVFTVFGTNVSNPSASDWEEVLSYSVEGSGTFDHVIHNVFKYYRVDKVDAETCTAKIILVESVYNFLVLYKTLSKAYKANSKLVGDFWEQRFMYYEDKYMTLVMKGRKFYDANDDGVIDSTERNQDVRTLRIGL